MKVTDALQGVTRVFLDTAPVIYYVEATPNFVEVATVAFNAIGQGQIQGVVSPVTLAECLTLPIRLGQLELQQRFKDFLIDTEGISLIEIDSEIGQKAAELRVKYALKLPDALQIAAAIVTNCDVFLTNDVALKKVAELRVLPLVELDV